MLSGPGAFLMSISASTSEICDSVMVLLVLLVVTSVLAELPPSISSRTFKTHPQVTLQALKSYKVPQKQILQPLKDKLTAGLISSKLTIEQLIQLTEKLSSQQNGAVPTGYQRIPQNKIVNHHVANQAVPQTTYGVPNNKFSRPSSSQWRPFPQNSASKSPVPQTSYGVPIANPPATTYGVPDTSLEMLDKIRQQQKLTAFPAAQNFQQNGYSTIEPILRDIENSKANQGLSQQYLPIKEAGNFRNTQNFNQVQHISNLLNQNQQYIPRNQNSFTSNSAGSVELQQGNVRLLGIGDSSNSNTMSTNNLDDVDGRYLPPTTTSRPLLARPSRTPPATSTTEINTEAEGEAEETTEEPVQNDGNPNVAIATAVSGGNGIFYVQRPDGQLQRVIFQKTREEASQPEEYTASYHFQNIHALPNVVYAPLSLVRK